MAVQDIILHTSGPLGEDEIRQLEGLGLRVVNRLAGGALRVRGESAATAADLVGLGFVDSAAPFDPVDKLDPVLSAATELTRAAAGFGPGDTTLRILVTLDEAADTAATTARLGELGEVIEAAPRRALVSVPASRVAELAALDGVLHAEIEPDPRTQNNVARGLAKVEPAAVALGLDGSGEIVGVADSGLDTGVATTVLADFAGRVVNIRATVTKAPANGADLNNHGTHVCGSIAGDGTNSNGTVRGMAPAARLTVLSMGPNNGTGLSVPLDLVTGVFTDAYADGARIHSNSWGSNANLGKYTAFSEDVDDFVWNHPDMLVVIAAGNSGSGASTVSAPGTAKNCLTAGASESVRPLPAAITISPNPQDADHNPATPRTNVPLTINAVADQADNADDIAGFSGRGPVNDTGDNRTKPDIVAPGTFILSCRSSVSTADVGPDGLPHSPNLDAFYADDADGVATHAEAVGRGLPGGLFFGAWSPTTPAAPAGSGANAQQSYFYDSGTSMATPITSGCVALLRQYLRQRRGIANPSAALMKAMIVNAAGVPGAASNAPDDTRGFGWLDVERLLTPAPTGQQVFSDDPQLAVATGEVRQLSLQVADATRPLRVTLAWTDRPGKGLQNKLYLRVVPPGGGAPVDGDVTAFPNPRNNVQRVHIATPVAGTYTIEVHGVDVAFGSPGLAPALRQDFALAVINGVGFSPKPVDVAQVIDHSGSMGFYSFMAPARERSKQLVDVLRVNDRTGVVQFDHAAAQVQPVMTITGAATQATVKAAIDTIAPAGATSIGGGLAKGVAELAAGGDPTHPQAIVLVSDGHENTPPWVGGGLPDSPPSWFTGTDRTESLPSVPATTKIYTVSLGVASDEVLLQAIAAARGGLFQAIHSAAENGRLHEIYVHLQALVGGEEVIAAGSDAVDGIGAASDGTAAATVAPPPDLPELAGLLAPGSPAAQAILAARSLENVHVASVDDTLGSVAFLVSWHDRARPVSLRLVTPSLKVITATTTAHQVVAGSSYLVIRVDAPEAGDWELRVRAGKTARGVHAYTWGAHGDSPIGLRLTPPPKPLGKTRLRIGAALAGLATGARSVTLTGRADVSARSIEDLIDAHRAQLKAVKLKGKPDAPTVDPNLARLPLLDLQLAAKGEPSLFETTARKLSFRRPQPSKPWTAQFAAPVSGISAIAVTASGVTAAGSHFTRLSRLDVRT
jgi:serine protease AprX